jgi:hypothetical protein
MKCIQTHIQVLDYIPEAEKTVAIDTPGGNLSLKIKSRAQQITLNPNIIKVKILLANDCSEDVVL